MSANQMPVLTLVGVSSLELAVFGAVAVVVIVALLFLFMWMLVIGRRRLEESSARRSEVAMRKTAYETLQLLQRVASSGRAHPTVVDSTLAPLGATSPELIVSRRLGVQSRLVWADPGSLGAKLYALAHWQWSSGNSAEAQTLLMASVQTTATTIASTMPPTSREVNIRLKDVAVSARKKLADSEKAQSSAALARTLTQVGLTNLAMGDVHQAVDPLAQASKMSNQLGDREGESFELFLLGVARESSGQVDLAESAYRKSLLLAQGLRLETAVADTQYRLGHILRACSVGLCLAYRGVGIQQSTAILN